MDDAQACWKPHACASVYAQGCVGKLAALLHAPRARVWENGIFLLDYTAPCSGAMPLCGARANAVSLLDFFNIIIVPAVFHMPLVIRTVDILDLFGHRYTGGDRLVEDEPNLRGIPQIDLLCQ